MEQDEKLTDRIQQTITEIKKYFSLQQQLLKVEGVEKLTIILSTFIAITLAVLLGTSAMFYLLFALAYLLEPIVGGLALSLTLIGICYLIFMSIIIIFRRQLIVNPLVKFLSHLFLKDDDN